jgi:LDH2 family malate/lactate/ureidoglycolate dehydrogenase
MIGISLTNAAPLVVPTNGATAILGTNPIAFGAPGLKLPFLLDMATSVVPRGKLEVADRQRRQMPVGWAVDETGYDSRNPGHVLANMLARAGGGILPLGGRGEQFGGHKGYGLALMVDVLCGVLSGSAYGWDVDNLDRPVPEGEIAAPRVGHFFMAMDIARFMPLDRFRARLDGLVTMLKESLKALDQTTIYIHGEKEAIRAALHETGGVPVTENVLESLRRIASECGVDPPATLGDRVRRLVEGLEADE